MEYAFLTEEERKATITDRLRQFEREHYGHALNKTAAETDTTLDAEKKQAKIDEANKSMAVIEHAINEGRKELAKFKDKVPVKEVK